MLFDRPAARESVALWTSSAEKLPRLDVHRPQEAAQALLIVQLAGLNLPADCPGLYQLFCDRKEELEFLFHCLCVRVYVLQSLNRAPLPPARRDFSVNIASTEQRIYFLAITGINPLQTAWNGSYLSQG